MVIPEMTDDQYIIRCRFIEAVDTEWRMPSVKGPARVKSFWPEFAPTDEDIAGWGEMVRKERFRETREMVKSAPDRDAIARHDECLDWSVSILTNEDHRKVLWGWARCTHRDRPFTEWCDKQGVVSRTAYRRLNRAVDLLIAGLRKRKLKKSPADEERVSHFWDPYGIKSSMVGNAYGSASAA